MQRPFLQFTAVAALAAMVVLGASELTRRVCVQRASQAGDDLAWLQEEFSLNARELERIRQLHQGYLPQCRAFCERIAQKSKELETALTTSSGVNAETETRLKELALLRAECQTRMLRHFQEVAAAMPTAQGQRYFSEMQRLTLGKAQPYDHAEDGSASHHGHH